MFTFPTMIFCRGVPGFATDCPRGVWCRGLTTCPLYVGPLFGSFDNNDYDNNNSDHNPHYNNGIVVGWKVYQTNDRGKYIFMYNVP